MLTACLNGARRPQEHPALPVTPAELAADAARVVAAGADALHLHAKDSEGVDSLQGEHVDRAVAAVRADTTAPVGVSTGAWAEPDPAARVRAINSWTVLPDFASVNWHEPGAEHIATALLEKGVAVEAGLWHVDAARTWAHSPLRETCLRVLVELPAGLDPAQAVIAADNVLSHLRHAGKHHSRPAARRGHQHLAMPAPRRPPRPGHSHRARRHPAPARWKPSDRQRRPHP